MLLSKYGFFVYLIDLDYFMLFAKFKKRTESFLAELF